MAATGHFPVTDKLPTGLLWCLQAWIGLFYLLFLVPLAFNGGLGLDSW